MGLNTAPAPPSTANVTEFYPIELQYITALFGQRQYRQCIGACRIALESLAQEDQTPHHHPAFEAFANFYLALAHDELARLMHEHAQLKLPTYNQAEIYYQSAVRAVPTLDQCQDALTSAVDDRMPPAAIMVPPSLPSQPSLDSEPSASFPSSPPVFACHLREGSLPSRSPQEENRDMTTSDLSEYSSHDSFDEIMTPNRVLKRDVSRMSLLDQPLERDYSSMSLLAPPPQLQRSTSQGLLRPIRPGSPPKAYHLPPKLPYIGKMPSKSRIPHLPALRTSDSPTRQPRSTLKPTLHAREDASPSPVSSVGSAVVSSDTSTVSPISLETSDQRASPEPRAMQMPLALGLSRLNEHLEAIHAQLQTHLVLLRRARLATTIAQAERASRSAAPTHGSICGMFAPAEPLHERAEESRRGGRQANNTRGGSKRIATSKSFWTFTPAAVKAAELDKKIELGRARNWERKRFQPQRYRELAEKALAEL